jgi:hypothetical protein
VLLSLSLSLKHLMSAVDLIIAMARHLIGF